jgi:hypothetical protein
MTGISAGPARGFIPTHDIAASAGPILIDDRSATLDTIAHKLKGEQRATNHAT